MVVLVVAPFTRFNLSLYTKEINMKKDKLIIVLLLCVIVMLGAFTIKSRETPAPAPTGGEDSVDLVADVETLPSGRYVKVTATEAADPDAPGNDDDKNRIINLSELEVLDASGTNIAKGKSVTGSSEWPSTHLWPKLTDGVIDPNNFAHTMGRTPEEVDFMTIDLGEEKEIKTIKIHNRTVVGDHCCGQRAIGLKVQILDESSQLVKETPVISSDSKDYTFTFLTDTDWRTT